MITRLRWGILSTAGINVALVPAIRNSQRSELIAIASRSKDKAEAYARENRIPHVYGSYDSLISDPEIDVVYIPLPNTMHCEWTVHAAQSGKHVLCEKPIVTTLAEMEKIEKAARENDVVVFEAFMSLHAPQNIRVKKMIEAGKLGELQFIDSWFTYFLPPEDKHNIRLNPTLGGGALWDVGVYPISLAIATAGVGPPREVWATQVTGETGVDIMFAGQMVFSNGMVAHISCGLRAPFAYGARFVGTHGIVRIADPVIPGMKNRVESGPDSRIEFSRKDGTDETIVIPSANPWSAEVEAMEACVLDGAEPIVPLNLSKQFVVSGVALSESARTGQVERL